ncbi:MAG: DUF2218 domain-containing protein [Marinibacterium sp.]|nr:DUF2218 domain-containing protein [Marinibacterium sp.]
MTITARSTYETTNASRFLQQLCKHFAHKVPATFDDQTGEVTFSCGRARMRALADRLDFVIESGDRAGLDQTKAVIEDHLLRFAFRETPQPLIWSD